MNIFQRKRQYQQKQPILQEMNLRKSKSTGKDIRYILHPLNISKSKSTYSFEKSNRFHDPKSHSPNKFYDIPQSKQVVGFSMTKGCRHKFQNLSSIPPNKYAIVSQFEPKKHIRMASDTFGISRQLYYKAQKSKQQVGPGAYNIKSQIGSKSFYMGQKLRSLDKPQIQTQLHISNAVNKLSIFNNQNAAVRLKTEYFPKDKYHKYDNRVPGPGAYSQTESKSPSYRNTMTTFGATQRLKNQKQTNLGPGSYPQFSQFGNYQRC